MNKQMTEFISQWRASGLTKAAFCRKQQISIHQFNYWLKKFPYAEVSKSESNEIHFFSIENQKSKNIPAKANDKAKAAIVVELPHGIKINFFSC